MEMSADVYQLIVREIPQLRSDQRILELLEASVAENVTTVLHILQHGIDMEKVHAPEAAEEYARRLAQRGVPIAALLRAYRIGSARFEDWCLQELGRRTDNAAEVAPLALMSGSIELLQTWVIETLGALAADDAQGARLRDTLRVFLQEVGNYKTTAERLVLLSGKAPRSCGRLTSPHLARRDLASGNRNNTARPADVTPDV
jgi:hypothetical protein